MRFQAIYVLLFTRMTSNPLQISPFLVESLFKHKTFSYQPSSQDSAVAVSISTCIRQERIAFSQQQFGVSEFSIHRPPFTSANSTRYLGERTHILCCACSMTGDAAPVFRTHGSARSDLDGERERDGSLSASRSCPILGDRIGY